MARNLLKDRKHVVGLEQLSQHRIALSQMGSDRLVVVLRAQAERASAETGSPSRAISSARMAVCSSWARIASDCPARPPA